MGGNTRPFFLIGNPVEHSVSPLIHNTLFERLGINGVYVPLKVQRGFLGEVVEGLRHTDFGGANVTIPFKVEIVRFLDRLDEKSRVVGAVNTVRASGGMLEGYNTDVYGVRYSFRRHKVDVSNSKVVIIGAGGAARAVIAALAEMGVGRVDVVNRTISRAVSLKRDLENMLGIRINVEVYGSPGALGLIRKADILVNATPVGMYPEVDRSPIPAECLGGQEAVFDVVYNPFKTKLLEDAEDAGIKAIPGAYMLAGQAAEAFKLWTGIHPPEDLVLETTLRALGV